VSKHYRAKPNFQGFPAIRFAMKKLAKEGKKFSSRDRTFFPPPALLGHRKTGPIAEGFPLCIGRRAGNGSIVFERELGGAWTEAWET